MAADYKRPDEAAMQRILERYPYSPEGAIIRLAWLQGLSREELNQLTWDQVDFANRVLLPERTVPMAEPVAECLQKRWALYHEQSERQKALNEPKVFVAPTTGRPIDLSRISVVSRTAMIRGGLENFSLRALCTWAAAQKTGELLTAQAERQGPLVREDVMRLLNVSANTAWSRLNRLAESGQLEKVGVRYYPKGRVVPPEEQLAVLRGYLAEHSIASRQDFVKLLHVTPHQATNILKHMVERGELIRVGKRYQLPQEAQPAEK